MASVDNSVSTFDELVAQLETILCNDDNSSNNVVSHVPIQTHNLDSKNNGQIMNWENSCSHPSLLNLICTSCGQRLQDNYGLPFGYTTKGLRLSKAEADKLRDLKTDNVLSKRKLILVLDLDQTLINSSQISALSPGEKYIGEAINSRFNIVKLRPFVHEFLQEASTMFEMYVYTLSTQIYAKYVIKLLDPDNKYFGSRLITRENSVSPRQKSLDIVLGRERTIVVLDDRKDVWPTHNANLIQVNGYNFFASSLHDFGSKTESLAEQKSDENQYIMASYLNLLKLIHSRFFDGPKLKYRDVRDVIKKVRLEILEGDKILFRHFEQEKSSQLEQMAKRMGAICARELDSSVTHVVTKNAGEKEHQWAYDSNNHYLVDPRWIRDSYKLWHRVPEKCYMLFKINKL